MARTKAEYAGMKVTELQAELKERSLPYGGLKKALVDRLVKDDQKAPKKVAPPKKEVKKKGPAPKEKKPPIKPKAKEKQVTKKETEKPLKKPPVKKEAKKKPAKKPKSKKEAVKKKKDVEVEMEEEEKTEVEMEEEKTEAEEEKTAVEEEKTEIEMEEEEETEEKKPPKKVPITKKKVVKKTKKEEAKSEETSKKSEFDKVDFPDKNYCINAEDLAKIVYSVFVETKAGSQVSKFKKFFSELEGYIDSNESETETVKIETESGTLEKSKHKEETLEVETVAEETEEPDVAKEEAEEEAEIAVVTKYNDALSVYATPDGYVWDPKTSSVFGKIVDGKVVSLTKDDLSLYKARFWHLHVKGRGASEFATGDEIKDLIAQSKKHRGESKSPEPVEDDEELEKYFEKIDVGILNLEEEDDDGKVVEEKTTTEKSTTVDKVEKEIKEVFIPRPEINEETFYKYVKAEYTMEQEKKNDVAAISEKAGLSLEVGKQIVSQYYALHDRYPKAVSDAQISSRSSQPQRVTRPPVQVRATAALPTRRLLQ